MDAFDSTNRFSNRANNYDQYRPGYPAEIITYLQKNIPLVSTAVIADIGAGTGIFSGLLLNAGFTVMAVEPNAPMRIAAEKNLQEYAGFKSIAGTAEQTNLTARSIDLITVAQAFHWFHPEAVKPEFARVLKPDGHVLLLWNIIQSDTPFLAAYNALKEHYAEKLHHPNRANLQKIQEFFDPVPVTTHQIRHTQSLDFVGLAGHLLSFSTVPSQGSSEYFEMMADLNKLFTQFAENGLVTIQYETMLFLSQLQARD